MSPPRLPPALLALSPGRLSDGESGSRAEGERLLAAVRAAAGAGLAGVLVREPGLGDRALLELALRVRAVLDEAWAAGPPVVDLGLHIGEDLGEDSGDDPGGERAWLGIHDRPHLARAARADGVHLGFRSLPPEAARALVPPTCAIGVSTHAGDALESLACDYLFHGPVRATPSKAGLKEPIGFEALARAARASDAPLWAIGGLEPADLGPVLAAGARGVAVLRGVLAAADPARATAAWVAARTAARRESL